MFRAMALAMIFAMLCGTQAFGDFTIIAEDSFEDSGLWGGTGWSDRYWKTEGPFSSSVSATFYADQAYDGNVYVAMAYGNIGHAEMHMTRTVDLSEAVSPELSFYWAPNYIEAGEGTIAVEFDNGSGTFETLDTIAVPAETFHVNYTQASFLLPGPMIGTNQRVRLKSIFDSVPGESVADRIFIDAIKIRSVPEPVSIAMLGAAGLLAVKRKRQ